MFIVFIKNLFNYTFVILCSVLIACGTVPSPFDCFLANRGMKTLHVRMREHQKNATAVAQFLETSPYVEKVIYPGLPSHPQHELMKKQAKGFSGMVTFYIKGNLQKFFDAVKVCTCMYMTNSFSLCMLWCFD